MTYYLIELNAIQGYDSLTKYNSEYKPYNIGIQFSSYPLDDLMVLDSRYFCTERFYYTMTESNSLASIINIKHNNIRTEKNSNWMANHPLAEPEKMFEIEFTGIAFEDHLALLKQSVIHERVGSYKVNYLIASQEAVSLLLLNHCPCIFGIKVEKDLVLEPIRKMLQKDSYKYRFLNNWMESQNMS